MTDSTTKNPFEFEALLKSIETQLNNDQRNALLHWRENDIACTSEWERFELNTTEDNAIRNKNIITTFLNGETETKTLIANLFMSIPDPATAIDLFDAGKEEDRRKRLREDVIKIEDIVAAAFTKNKTNSNAISNFLTEIDNQPSTPDTPLTPEHNHIDEGSNTVASDHSLNIWGFADSANELGRHTAAEMNTDNNVEQWVSTLNNNQEIEEKP